MLLKALTQLLGIFLLAIVAGLTLGYSPGQLVIWAAATAVPGMIFYIFTHTIED